MQPLADLVVDLEAGQQRRYRHRERVAIGRRQQLFTENTLTPVLPLLHNRNVKTLVKVLRLWSLVLLANIAATWVFAFAVAHSSVFEPDVKKAFSDIGAHALRGSFDVMLLRSVFAGWLIALMVSDSARGWFGAAIHYHHHYLCGVARGLFASHRRICRRVLRRRIRRRFLV